jgi:hypothetical protein
MEKAKTLLDEIARGEVPRILNQEFGVQVVHSLGNYIGPCSVRSDDKFLETGIIRVEDADGPSKLGLHDAKDNEAAARTTKAQEMRIDSIGRARQRWWASSRLYSFA